jgi:hypothetical protein
MAGRLPVAVRSRHALQRCAARAVWFDEFGW